MSEKGSRLIKALANRIYVKFMQIEIGLLSSGKTASWVHREAQNIYQFFLKAATCRLSNW